MVKRRVCICSFLFSQAVQVNETLYISGQIGLNPETMEFPSGDTEEQTRQALTNMGAILKEAGSSFKNVSFSAVVKVTVLLDDINDFTRVNDVYKTFFTDKQPARAAYQAAKLPKAAKVEIEAIAIVGEVQDM
jgi:2-iminobutanoate/2-iminopropanoate deaminase